MSIKITRNSMDAEMVSIYSNNNGKVILWGVVHIDMLMELGISEEELDNHDFEIKKVEPC